MGIFINPLQMGQHLYYLYITYKPLTTYFFFLVLLQYFLKIYQMHSDDYNSVESSLFYLSRMSQLITYFEEVFPATQNMETQHDKLLKDASDNVLSHMN